MAHAMRSIARPAGGPAGAFAGVILALFRPPPAQGSSSLLPSQLQLSCAEHPRASATAACAKKPKAVRVSCTMSATPGSVGRRRFFRGVAVPTTWSFSPSGSSRSSTIAVRSVFRCVASRKREAAGPRDEASQSPVGAQPSRGEYNSFLSPARAAGAPTFCNATESRQRTQPRGFPPPWLTPAFFGPPPPEKVRPVAHTP